MTATTLASPVYTLGNPADTASASWGGNVTDDWGVDWVVTGENGWSSSPPVRVQQEDKQGADGAWAGPGNYAARVVSLTGTAIARDQFGMLLAKERIKAAIGPRAQVTFRVDELHRSRQSMMRLSDQIEITDHGTLAFDWSLIMVADDPRRYSVTPASQTTGLPLSATTGRTYPRTYPYNYGVVAGGHSGSVYFTNDGDFDECPVTFTISGPVNNPTIAHVQTGRSLTYSLNVNDGEYLVIDLLNRSALLNGTSSRGGSLAPTSAWFWAVPGANEFQFRGELGTSSAVPPTTPAMSFVAASAWT